MFNSSIVGYIKHDNGNTNQNINEGQNIDVEHDDIIDELSVFKKEVKNALQLLYTDVEYPG